MPGIKSGTTVVHYIEPEDMAYTFRSNEGNVSFRFYVRSKALKNVRGDNDRLTPETLAVFSHEGRGMFILTSTAITLITRGKIKSQEEIDSTPRNEWVELRVKPTADMW